MNCFKLVLLLLALCVGANAANIVVDSRVSNTTGVSTSAVSATGNISAAKLIGNGAGVSGVTAASMSYYGLTNIPQPIQDVSTGVKISVTTVNGQYASFTTIAGTLSTAAQNSIQTMSGLTNVSVTGNISVTTINGAVPVFGGAPSWYTVTNIPTPVQNISTGLIVSTTTHNGQYASFTTLAVAGQNISATPSWYSLTNIPTPVQNVSTGLIISATTHNGQYASFTTVAGTLSTAAQNLIQTMTGLTNVSVTGNLSVTTINGQTPSFGSGSSGPTFRAYSGSIQSIANSSFTKIQFTTELWDSDNCFDNATNYRFTPNKSGYYLVTLRFKFSSPGDAKLMIANIYKNGSVYADYWTGSSGASNDGSLAVSSLIFFNGSTDYVEGFAEQESGSSKNLTNNSHESEFSAVFIRS